MDVYVDCVGYDGDVVLFCMEGMVWVVVGLLVIVFFCLDFFCYYVCYGSYFWFLFGVDGDGVDCV